MVGYSWGKKSSTWKVDHELDDMRSYASDSESRKSFGPVDDNQPVLGQLETPEEKKARRRSHLVAYTTMFVMSIGFSIVLSGVWPYLKQIDNSLEKNALGWVVAANPLGQMLASPLLGIWGNKAGSIRGACIVTVLFFIGGNVMYATLYAFKDAGKNVAYYMMIVARFIVGVSSANVTLCRSYLAGSTTLEERTTGIAVIAAAQAMGFVVGPVIQAVLTVAVPNSSSFPGLPGLVWDKYTSAGWVAALLGFINLIIVMPCIFQEYNIAEKERAQFQGGDTNKQMKLPKPDYLGISGILVAFFFVLFIYVLLETLAEPFVTDQYAVSDDFAMVAVGIALSVGGLLSIVMFVLTSNLAKKFDERKIMILMGMLPTVVGTFLYLPMGKTGITISRCDNDTVGYSTTKTTVAVGDFDSVMVASNLDDNYPLQYDFFYRSLIRSGSSEEGLNCTLGCPAVQKWCEHVPQLAVSQMLTAFIITVLGYPVVQALAQSIFSKMLGPKPQGLWMGILTGVGSLSRIAGPIFVAYIYTNLGTYWTFGILATGMLLSLIGIVVLYRRLVPMVVPKLHSTFDSQVTNGKF